MALPASDNFNRANGNLGANWTDATGTNAIQVATNALQSNGGVDALIYWNADTFANDQVADLTVTAVGDSYLGPAVRCAVNNGYGFYAGQFGRYLFKIVAGVTTTISSDATSVTNGDVYELSVVGTQITVKRNGVDLFTPTDASLSSGRAGLAGFGSAGALRYDNWNGNNTTVPLSLEQEGFRFRDDDGSEAAATWRQTQDANDSVARSVNERLRVLINATGDPASQNYQLEVRKAGSLDWRKVQ
jgi:hypothetical protein